MELWEKEHIFMGNNKKITKNVFISQKLVLNIFYSNITVIIFDNQSFGQTKDYFATRKSKFYSGWLQKCGTRARVFSGTLARENSEIEMKRRNMGRTQEKEHKPWK